MQFLLDNYPPVRATHPRIYGKDNSTWQVLLLLVVVFLDLGEEKEGADDQTALYEILNKIEKKSPNICYHKTQLEMAECVELLCPL